MNNEKMDDVLEKLLKAQVLLNAAMSQMADLVADEIPMPEAGKAAAAVPAPEVPAPSAAEVRAAFKGLIDAGKRDEVARILSLFGVSKFTEVDASRYTEVMAEIEKARG